MSSLRFLAGSTFLLVLLEFILEKGGLVQDLLLCSLLHFDESLVRWRPGAVSAGLFQGLPKDFFVKVVFDPGRPLKEWYIQFNRPLIKLNCANRGYNIQMRTIQFDWLASQGEELLHGITVQHVFHLRLVFKCEATSWSFVGWTGGWDVWFESHSRRGVPCGLGTAFYLFLLASWGIHWDWELKTFLFDFLDLEIVFNTLFHFLLDLLKDILVRISA